MKWRFTRPFGGRGDGASTERELASLRVEVERLRSQNDHMKRAMRQCIDCEYRIEVVADRAARGLTADGSTTTPGDAASNPEPHQARRHPTQGKA